MSGYITADLLIALLRKNFPSFSMDDSWIVDEAYKCMSMQELGKAIVGWREWLKRENMMWTANEYDCDDFAEDFRRFCVQNFDFIHPLIAIGKLYTPKGDWGFHAWNIIPTYKWGIIAGPDLRLWEFEPQTARILINHQDWQDRFRYELMWVYA